MKGVKHYLKDGTVWTGSNAQDERWFFAYGQDTH